MPSAKRPKAVTAWIAKDYLVLWGSDPIEDWRPVWRVPPTRTHYMRIRIVPFPPKRRAARRKA